MRLQILRFAWEQQLLYSCRRQRHIDRKNAGFVCEGTVSGKIRSLPIEVHTCYGVVHLGRTKEQTEGTSQSHICSVIGKQTKPIRRVVRFRDFSSFRQTHISGTCVVFVINRQLPVHVPEVGMDGETLLFFVWILIVTYFWKQGTRSSNSNSVCGLG